MSEANPDYPVVVAAHDRPVALRRLAASLEKADVASGTPLVVSIDGGGTHYRDVKAVADAIDWPHGAKTVVEQDQIGLVNHFFACGDLTEQYGAVVFLEDDLIVAPGFHAWARRALTFAAADDRIAGVSLATPFFDGYRHLPFEPAIDGSDGLFMQVPWYDGMAWTAAMWQSFRSHRIAPTTPVHQSLLTLATDEWFPDAIRYLVETDRYYLLPRHAQATNSGAAGTHFDTSTDYFQVPLSLRAPSEWRLSSLDESVARYDDHMELSATVVRQLVPALVEVDLTVDLLGVRDLDQVKTSHVLTTRQVKQADRLWGSSLHPLIANLVHQVAGDTIRLAATSDVLSSTQSADESLATLAHHARRGQQPSSRDAARQLVAELHGRLRRGR